MPEREITESRELAIVNQGGWLEQVKARGGSVELVDCQGEGTILTDTWLVDGRELKLVTDLANRARLNKVICDIEIAIQLEEAGIVPFSEKPQEGIQTPTT